jgi:hypothetical protein
MLFAQCQSFFNMIQKDKNLLNYSRPGAEPRISKLSIISVFPAVTGLVGGNAVAQMAGRFLRVTTAQGNRIGFYLFFAFAFVGYTAALLASHRIKVRDDLRGAWVATVAVAVNGIGFGWAVLVCICQLTKP